MRVAMLADGPAQSAGAAGEVVAEVVSRLCWRMTAWLCYRVDGAACVSRDPYGSVVSHEVLPCSW